MRALFVALTLFVPLASAEPAETIRQCTEFGCVVAEDTDGNGEYDWANVAIVPSGLHTFGLSANVNGTVVTWEGSAGTEELGETIGVETETFHMLFAWGEIRSGSTSSSASLEEGDEESGEWRALAAATASTRIALP